jgi:hypothetical protein
MFLTNRNLSRTRVILLLVLAIFVYIGCCCKPTPIVVIRGSDLRSDLLPLPLSEVDRNALNDYLKKGGDRENEDTVTFYSETFYKGVLDLLSNDDKIEMDDLFVHEPSGQWKLKDAVKQWFKRPAVYGVYDSRCKRPSLKTTRPFSLFDGHFWWVFYRESGDSKWLRKVLVTVPVSGAVPHSWQE